ncbi:MAG: sugar phosphate nucleotidyltransferase [Deltaproteobacteria bacterium]|nr:sugar phosphate nucleotidyltransferase [Deltaproteobacteria bacterium]MCX7952510.1 sugar phosphate nucleotidyltransferase [Deltaproteobacteria bacterium]
MDTVGVLLAGGIGSRFWPLSRQSRPKQFLKHFNGKTFLRCAVDRLLASIGENHGSILVVTNEKYKDLAVQEAPEAIILPEKEGRNTAPAIAYAVAKAKSLGAKKMIVAPADHVFENEEKMVLKLKSALEFVEKSPLIVIFGQKPMYPHTGYGYIKVGGYVDEEKFPGFRYVRRFHEKPNLERAKSYVSSGEFLWNMGIFVWSLESILRAFEDELPDYFEAINEISKIFESGQDQEKIFGILNSLEPVSIDLGLIERVRNISVMEVEDCGWSDIGNLKVWVELIENSGANSTEHIQIDSNGVKVYVDKGLVVTVGVSDLFVVKKDDIILICDKERISDVGKIPGILAERGLDQYI